MLFFCFSVKDRFPIVNDFNQYIGNFGIKTWYDRRNIYLGNDRREENIEHGAKNKDVDYAVVFYSENFANGNICKEELAILIERYRKKELHIFPVFLGGVPSVLEPRFQILKKLVYKQIFSSEEFLALSLHITAKITCDRLKKFNYTTFSDYLLRSGNDNKISCLLREYGNIDKKNYAMRIAYLFGIFKSITYGRRIDYLSYKTMHFLFYSNCYSVAKEEKRELQVMENICLEQAVLLAPIR